MSARGQEQTLRLCGRCDSRFAEERQEKIQDIGWWSVISAASPGSLYGSDVAELGVLVDLNLFAHIIYNVYTGSPS